MTKALIFDMDGVIVASDPVRFQILQNIFSSKNLSLSDNLFPHFAGRTTLDFLQTRLQSNELIDEILQEYNIEYKGNLIKHIQPISITVQFLQNYVGSLKFALASNSTRKVIDEITNYLKIADKFNVIISRDNVTYHKPNPEIYLKTAELLKEKPEECIVIEDSVTGAQAAINAKMKCYILLNSYNSKEEFSNISVSGFIENEEDFQKLLK